MEQTAEEQIVAVQTAGEQTVAEQTAGEQIVAGQTAGGQTAAGQIAVAGQEQQTAEGQQEQHLAWQLQGQED